MMLNVEAYFVLGVFTFSAMLVGGLLFAGATVAPIAVKVLPEPAAATFLRAFWPRYYRSGAAGGALVTAGITLLLVSVGEGPGSGLLLAGLAGSFSLGLWASLRMVPAINAARDARDVPRFQRLHRRVLGLTAASLVAGLAFLAALGWMLPAGMLL
jgi:hypothetical protein